MRASFLWILSAAVGLTACTDGSGGTATESTSGAASATDSTTSGTATDGTATGTGTDTDTGTGTDTDGTALPGCECVIVETDHSLTSPSLPLCGDQVCPIVTGSCEGYCDVDPLVLGSPEALTCALTALRDRTPGLVRWSWSQNGGQFTDSGYILIKEDGQAIHRGWGFADLSFNVDAARLGDLAPAATYDACLGIADDAERFNCLRDSSVSGDMICDEGWSGDNGI
ncbi:MAG: hypothetical protein H6711_28095 [Myxococcales bacterium]|nr:hypothetical protein [Myxococcales bacterium]